MSEPPYREGPSTELVVRSLPRAKPPIGKLALLAGGTACLLTVTAISLGPFAAAFGAAVALSGFYVLLGTRWADAHRTEDLLAMLPFRLVHDPPEAQSEDDVIRSMSFILESHEVAPMPPSQPRTLHELAVLLATWGVALHERYGIVEVRVAWTQG